MSLQTVLIIIGCIVITLIYVATKVTTRKSIAKNKASFGETIEEAEFVSDSEEDSLAYENQMQSQLDLKLSEDPQLGLFESFESNSQSLLEREDLIDPDKVIETLPQAELEILKLF